MRINKKLIPSNMIGKKKVYDSKTYKYIPREYVNVNNLGREINSVLIAVFIICLIIIVAHAYVDEDHNNYVVWNRQCQEIAGKNPHFFTNTPPTCHIGPNWGATIPI